MTTCSSLQTYLLSLFLVIMLMIFFRMKSKNRKNLPPSPRKLPIIGNFHQLGSNPNQSLHILSQKHGPLMLLHLGSIPMLIASSAEVAQEIFKTHDLSFSSRPNLTIPNILTYGNKDIAFAPYGEYWRQMKSIVAVHLLSNARVKSFRQVREEELSRMIGVLEESGGSLVDMGSLLMSLANNTICRVAVGRALSGLEKNARKIAKEFDEFLDDIVEDHLNKKRCDGAANEVQDLVDVLLDVQLDKTIDFNFQRDTIKAVILDTFLGGTDTTYTTLEWTIGELINEPRAMKKLQQEVTQTIKGRSKILEEDLEKMHYLKAVLKEALRLHPPAPLLAPRISTQDVKLYGYDIPKGTQLMVNVWAIARDPEIWKDPLKFRPERFLNTHR
ncbi:hypothetical protein LXL04_032190 [Taraxacum kok-saghyz]